MGHCTVPEAEAVLDKEFKVLDKGFVRMLDYLGSDERIVQAARVSYGEGTKSYRQDKGLINYLLRNDHTSPFEQIVFTFHLKMPLFVARQWIRHRTARLNEISGRYSVLKNECYIPDNQDIAKQSEDNKQGRESEPFNKETAEGIKAQLKKTQNSLYKDYESLLSKDLAREIARINLPLSLYTEMYWQIDLHNLFHFLRLRMDAHAQKEIRDYADVLFELASKVCPMACESFLEHKVKGENFSGSELEAVKAMIQGKENPLSGRNLELFNQKLNLD